MLYIDDGSFTFTTREQLKTVLNLIYSQFKKFGLEMHIGRGLKASKIEFIFFLPPGFWGQNSIAPDTSNNEYALSARHKESIDNRNIREEKEYTNLINTEPISVADGTVIFCLQFKYLGLWISYSLRYDYDVTKRLVAVNASMGAFCRFWDNEHVDVFSKYFLFRAIPCNFLLWGCESWSVQKSLLRFLELFLHRSIRCILKIPMRKVINEHIMNSDIRKEFYNITCIRNQIDVCQLTYIGKKIRREG